jgi:hypothetical protein
MEESGMLCLKERILKERNTIDPREYQLRPPSSHHWKFNEADMNRIFFAEATHPK